MKKETVGSLQMIACASMWSISGVLYKFLPWHAMVIAALRALIAGIVIYSFMCTQHTKLLLSRKTICCGGSLALTCSLFSLANKLTTAANAIVLQFTAPVFLLIFSTIFCHKKFRKADILAVVLTMIGISLFFLDQITPGALLGNVLAILAGAFMGVMYMLNGDATERERLSSVTVAQIVTVLLGLPFLFTTTVEMTTRSFIMILVLGVVQIGFANIMYTKAAGKCPPLACCLIGALEPLLNPVWVMLFYGETPGVFALLGGIVVIASITWWSIHSARHPAQE